MPSATDELLEAEIRPSWRLSAERSLYLAVERTLVVADIHWGYADSHRRVGNLLPMWGDAEIARRLRRLLGHYRPARMIWLGDSLHTPLSASVAEAFLDALAPELEVVVLAGNHDRAWPRAGAHEFRLGGCFFHHGDRAPEVDAGLIEIIGHMHPAIAWGDGAGLRLKVPALVEGPRRIILPSFSDWSAGAPWNGRLEPDERLWLISRRRIWAMTGNRVGPACP
ncbi:MAG: metallophosphoesterase [Verrucomicrobiota bacterium]